MFSHDQFRRFVKVKMNKLILDILLVILSCFGGGFAFYLFSKISLMPALFLAVMFCFVLILTVIVKLKREIDVEEFSRSLLDKESELDILKVKESSLLRDEATNLLSKTVEFTTKIIRRISECLRTLNSKDPVASESFSETFKDEIVRTIIKHIRLVFEGDGRSVDTTDYPHNYFKVALFEIDEENNKKYLKRTFYDYPEGIEPDDRTDAIPIDGQPRASHVMCYNSQKIICIQDIAKEIQKPEAEARWVDLRPNQHHEYKSMLAVPIVIGRRLSKDRKVLGVLVIDTDRENYFLENRNYQAFLGSLMSPFRTLLSFCLESGNWLQRL